MQHDKQVSNVILLMDKMPFFSFMLRSSENRVQRKFCLLVLRKISKILEMLQNPPKLY